MPDRSSRKRGGSLFSRLLPAALSGAPRPDSRPDSRPDPRSSRAGSPGNSSTTLRLILFMGGSTILTIVWLAGASSYIRRYVGWDNLFTLMPDDLALFASGVFGPVALVWLVMALVQMTLSGYRQEQLLQRLLAQEARTSGQVEAQVRSLIQMQEEDRRRQATETVDLVLKDLNAQAALLSERLGMLSGQEVDMLWARTGAGDLWAFAGAFLLRADLYPDFADMLASRLASDGLAATALQLFLRRYESLLATLRQTGSDRLGLSVLEDGPLARLFQLFEQVNQRSVSSLRQAASPRDAARAGGQASDPAGGRGIDESISRLQDVMARLEAS